MLMREQDLCHLFRFISQCCKCFHVAADVFAAIGSACFIRHFFRCPGRESRVNQNYLVSGVNQIVLQAAAIPDGWVKLIRAFLPAECKGLRVKTVLSEFYCFDLHFTISFNIFLTAMPLHRPQPLPYRQWAQNVPPRFLPGQ